MLYRSTFQLYDSPGNHWKQPTMQRTKANLKDGTCQWFPLVCKTYRPCWFTDKNKVPFCVSQCWCETLLKQDFSLFTGAHLSKVMAWKIWMSLKGNRDYKAIIHFLFYWHCPHSLDRPTRRVTSLLLSHRRYGPNEEKAIIKTLFTDGCRCNLHMAGWFSVNPNHSYPIIIISSIYRMWNWES